MPISGVHSIMMEKSALAGEGRGCTPTPLQSTVITITYKVAVFAPAERAEPLHLFHLYPYMYSVMPPTEYTEWQRPLSGAHSIMTEKLAQAC
jgi:hypothetical protein